MKIRYIGPGGWTTISKDGTLYKFNPECEVEDEALIKMLSDNPGFEVVHSGKAIEKAAEELCKPPDKQEVEGYPCPYCNFVSKSKTGLTSHVRSKHKKVKK
ncbi:MAG: hypothetical protein PHF74_05595 [Dehalococcoidales bacterium]|nr:hypothetical protein [Dehalococcoidales bacterium]